MLQRIARVLMNEADASPGGGAAASTPTTPDAQAQEPATAAQPITLEAIAKLLEQNKNSVEANTRRMIEGALGKKKGEPAKADPSSSGVSTPTPATSPDSKKWATFNRKAGALGLNEKAIARLEKAFEVENPEDVAGWFDDFANDLGIKPTSAPAVATPSASATPAQQPNAAPSAATPAPSTSVPGDGPDQVRKWDEHQIRAYLGKTPGGNGGNPMHWSNRKASIEIAERLAGELAGYRIVSSKK